MILGVVFIFFLGFLGLFGLAFAFDAPGSSQKASNWVIVITAITVPILISLAILVFAFLAFRSGNYTRSVLIGSVFGILVIGGLIFSATSSYFTIKKMNAIREQEAEDARLYPTQKYLRPVEGGVDTIIVFPNRIVAYRLYVGVEHPYGGPLGDLNSTRDTLLYREYPDTRIARNELDQFKNEEGRSFTDV
jgi:hypothetical protein